MRRLRVAVYSGHSSPSACSHPCILCSAMLSLSSTPSLHLSSLCAEMKVSQGTLMKEQIPLGKKAWQRMQA